LGGIAAKGRVQLKKEKEENFLISVSFPSLEKEKEVFRRRTQKKELWKTRGARRKKKGGLRTAKEGQATAVPRLGP